MSIPSASERERLAALDSLGIMDTASETVFDDLAQLAARLTDTSTALISLVDARRQWVKASVGIDMKAFPGDHAFCAHTMLNPSGVTLVCDATLDPRFSDNRLVIGDPNIRFYAGAPLVTQTGHVLGAVCVLDQEAKILSAEQQEALASLARTVMATMELRRDKRRAEELALTDPLTGLSNRRAFFDVLGRAIAKQERDGQAFGLIYLDLDGFKQVNDLLGHDMGDKLLREVGRVLLFSVRREDIVARLGGDEFAVLLSSDNVGAIGELVRRAIGRQMQALGWDVTASVGAVTFLSPPANEVAATIAADQMMYAAKAAGRDCTRHRESGRRAGGAVDPAIEGASIEAASDKTTFVGDTFVNARPATAKGSFDPAALRTHYQPIVDLRTGSVIGVEALARLWDGNQVIPPAAFLPGMSLAALRLLLFRVLDQGLDTLARCTSHPTLGLSVNIDPMLLMQPDFTATLLARLAASDIAQGGIGQGRVTLELLENGEILDQEMASRQLQLLRDSRVRIVLDDVGSGYSSLARLRNLPIDGVKLDQAFVRGVWQRPSDLLFVTNMMSLANGLGRSFVVEGVETHEILDALAVLGVGPAQGYAIARPMPGDALPGWLAAHVPTPASRTPASLLGVYASHLNIVRATQALMHQPLEVTWLEQAYDPHACLIGHYFDRTGLHDTAYGLAHKRFHTVLSLYHTDKQRWEEAAETFRLELEIAIHRGRYDPA